MQKLWEKKLKKILSYHSFLLKFFTSLMNACLEQNTNATHWVITSLCKIMDQTLNEMYLSPLKLVEDWKLELTCFEEINRKQTTEVFLSFLKTFLNCENKMFYVWKPTSTPQKRRKCFLVNLELKHLTISSLLTWISLTCIVVHFWSGSTSLSSSFRK